MKTQWFAFVGILASLAVAGQGQTRLAIHRAEEPPVWPERYGQQVDLEIYPQSTPQEAIEAVVKALKGDDVAYMLAHLISPAEVDRKLKGDLEAFRELTGKATPKKTKAMVDQLERLLSDGTWTMRRNLCWATVDGRRDLTLEKIGKRWFMHNTPVARPKSLK